MNRMAYQFAPLRYVHDTVTGEFLNVGIAVYCREARYLDAKISTRYSRLSDAFQSVAGDHYRRLVRHIETAVRRIGERWASMPLIREEFDHIEGVLATVLPSDDSSIQFGPAGGGMTGDPEATLAQLYERFVERYARSTERVTRSREDVWATTCRALTEYGVTEKLQPVRICSPDYEYEFQHAWKNNRWHPIEPVSFDYVNASDILEKANKWVGRATCLKENDDMGQLYLVLGAPRDTDLRDTFVKAQHILRRMPLDAELVHESEVGDLAAMFARKIAEHEE